MYDTVIWGFQILLALWFAMPAFMKLTTPIEKMVEANQLQPGGNPTLIRMHSFIALLSISGTSLPHLFGVASILSPITAVGFAVVMTGSFILHFNKREFKILPKIA